MRHLVTDAQATTASSLQLLVATSEKLIFEFLAVAAGIMGGEQSGVVWAAAVQGFSNKQKILAGHVAWPQCSEEAAEITATKSALSCVGSAVAVMDTFQQISTGHAGQLASSSLNRFIAVDAFSEAKPFINKKESLGESAVVENYQKIRAFFMAMQPKVGHGLVNKPLGFGSRAGDV